MKENLKAILSKMGSVTGFGMIAFWVVAAADAYAGGSYSVAGGYSSASSASSGQVSSSRASADNGTGSTSRASGSGTYGGTPYQAATQQSASVSAPSSSGVEVVTQQSGSVSANNGVSEIEYSASDASSRVQVAERQPVPAQFATTAKASDQAQEPDQQIATTAKGSVKAPGPDQQIATTAKATATVRDSAPTSGLNAGRDAAGAGRSAPSVTSVSASRGPASAIIDAKPNCYPDCH